MFCSWEEEGRGRSRKQFLVLDGIEEVQLREKIERLALSSDGISYAYSLMDRTQKKTFLFKNSEKIAEFQSIGKLVFDPSGKHVACVVMLPPSKGMKMCVGLDGKFCEPVDSITISTIMVPRIRFIGPSLLSGTLQ